MAHCHASNYLRLKLFSSSKAAKKNEEQGGLIDKTITNYGEVGQGIC